MVNSSVKVSVIIPIYNVEKYLMRCVDSLINQTLKDIEIILIDDGSPDNCGSICDEYAKQDERIKVVHKNNGGLSDARNKGLNEVSGAYIIFIDSDDWCEENMIEVLFNCIMNNKSDIAICGYSIDYSNNNYSIIKSLEEYRNNYANGEQSQAIYSLDKSGMFNVVWNKLYKKSLILDNKLSFDINGMPGEDLLFNCEYFKYVNEITFVSNILHHYMREDEDTLVSKYKKDLYEKCKYFNIKRKELYDFYGMNSKEYIECYTNTYIGYIFSCVVNIYRKETKLKLRDKNNFLKELLTNTEINSYMKQYKPIGLNSKLFNILYKTKNPYIINIIYSVLFSFRYKFEKLYRCFRKIIIR